MILKHFWETYLICFFTGSNAFKHTWTGGVTVRLYSEERDGKEFIVLEITDTGILILLLK